ASWPMAGTTHIAAPSAFEVASARASACATPCRARTGKPPRLGTGARSSRQQRAGATIHFTADLRTRLQASLSVHERREHALEGRSHAAVAVVLVDSDAERHDRDPLTARDIDMSVVPGDLLAGERRRLDGRMIGVAGGAA